MHAKKPLEKDIEKNAVSYAESCGWRHRKLDKGPGERAWPDHLFLGPGGQVFLVEFKRVGEGPRPQQLKRHRDLRALGFPVAIVNNFRLFQVLFDRIAKENKA